MGPKNDLSSRAQSLSYHGPVPLSSSGTRSTTQPHYTPTLHTYSLLENATVTPTEPPPTLNATATPTRSPSPTLSSILLTATASASATVTIIHDTPTRTLEAITATDLPTSSATDTVEPTLTATTQSLVAYVTEPPVPVLGKNFTLSFEIPKVLVPLVDNDGFMLLPMAPRPLFGVAHSLCMAGEKRAKEQGSPGTKELGVRVGAEHIIRCTNHLPWGCFCGRSLVLQSWAVCSSCAGPMVVADWRVFDSGGAQVRSLTPTPQPPRPFLF